MNDNDFDKAGRTWAHLDPPGMLRWLLPELSPACAFQRWADTRTIAFPGEPDRTCDTVAELLQAGESPICWLLVLELQSQPDKEIFGRLLEYLGRAWRGLHPLHQRRQRYHLAAALIHFKGRGRNSRDFRLPGTPARACLHIVEKNVGDDSAEDTLAQIETGAWTRALLPLIPLMQGGKNAGIIQKWQSVAASEPDERLRDEYATLARVFADLAKRGRIWRQALEGWNMKRSESVMEWQAEAEAKARSEDILEVLRLRFGTELPDDLLALIRGTTDLEQLKRWLVAAVQSRTLKKFRQALHT
jgi:hypothetical protein